MESFDDSEFNGALKNTKEIEVMSTEPGSRTFSSFK